MVWRIDRKDVAAYRFAIAHAIERDGSVAELHQVWDLVTPAKGHVREAMDENNGAFGSSFW